MCTYDCKACHADKTICARYKLACDIGVGYVPDYITPLDHVLKEKVVKELREKMLQR